jgi:hypothetical protein
MYAVLGSALVAGAVLGMALLSLLVRRPAASAFARSELTATLGSVVIAGGFGLGLTWLAMTPRQLAADGMSLAGIALVAAIWVGLVIVLRLLKPGVRLRAYDAAAAAGPALAVSNPEPTPPPAPRPRPSDRTRRAA